MKIDLSNYATKRDIKNVSHVDTSSFALKTSLANLKTEVDKLNIYKLIPIPAELSKLSNVVKNDVVKKDVYNRLVTKVDNIDTSGFVLKTKYETDKSELENKTPDTSGLVKKTDYNTKITEIKGKIPDISNLATKTALTTVENKINNISNLAAKLLVNKVENRIPDISNLVKKQTIILKLLIFKINLIIIIMMNVLILQSLILATNAFNTKVAQANLVIKTDFDAKLSSLNRNITKNKTDHLIVKNELNKLKIFDSSYYNGKSYFEEDEKTNCLIFQPLNKYFKVNCNSLYYVSSWTSKRLSNESIKPRTTSNNSLTPI